MNQFTLLLGSITLLSATAAMATDYDCSATIPVNPKVWGGERWGMQVYAVEKGKEIAIGSVQTIDVATGETELTIPLRNCTENTYYKVSFGKVSHKPSANEPWGYYYSQCYKNMGKTPEIGFTFEELGNNQNPEGKQFIYTGDKPANCN